VTRARLLGGASASLVILLLAPGARAQMGPGGGMGAPGGMSPQQPMQGEKEEGPAEEAPEEETRPADLEPLAGYPEQNKRKLQIFEVDGYLRLRADYMHNFFLGEGYTSLPRLNPDGTPGTGLPPFPEPLECARPTGTAITSNAANPGLNQNNPGSTCSHKNIGGANLRLRIEPTLNITDMVRVHAQFDVLDNTILGSTPDSLTGIYKQPSSTVTSSSSTSSSAVAGSAPTAFFSNSQDPPTIGQNGFVQSIVAKRAWAEIDSEFGSVRFGRMPWNFGRGLFYNDGGCPDCDVGTTVDRVMALTQLAGHQIAVAWDLGPQGYTSQQTSLGQQSPDGYPYDLSQNDDVLQLMASIVRKDNPVQLRERIDRGEPVLNYGVQLVYRNQGNTVTPVAYTPPPSGSGSMGPQALTPEQLNQAQLFGAFSFTPDVWAKFYYKALTLEFEGVGVFGKIDHPGLLAADNHAVTMRQMGWVAAAELRLYRDSFFVGIETGGATGDQAEDPSQYLNYRWRFVQQPVGDHAINDFHFSPDYHVDEIFFRHIMGTVTNAIYVKPQTSYWYELGGTRAIGINGSVIYSMAQVPVSTPGNSINYGIEGDVGATYRNTGEGVYGGVTWGLFFPMAALSRPQSLFPNDYVDASSAQILRIFMGVRF
jgi:uncharacterized protein (TIGR04551 family)